MNEEKSGGYRPEPYWSEVAQRIRSRGKDNVIAGDDEPYYRYKRKKFLDLLHSVDFSGKHVLEIGCGPGGNLLEVLQHNPASLTAVDISSEMAALAAERLGNRARIVKIDGSHLPFDDGSFDIVFTATVLQHNTDEPMLKQLMSEICRVSRHSVYLFERIDKTVTGDELCHGRPVDFYAEICSRHGFELISKRFINIRASYYVSGAIRKGLNPPSRQEGEPISRLSWVMQQITLPLTGLLDKAFPSQKDVARLEFRRRS